MGACFADLGSFDRRSEPRPSRLRLVCFPHSGGSCFAFQGLAELLPGVEVLGATLPGRGHRFAEEPDTRWDTVIAHVCAELAALAPKPYAVLGHSLGGLLAFESARRMVDDGADAPVFVAASACPPPHRHDAERSRRIAALADRELLELLAGWGGLAAADVERPAMQRMVPGIRADFALGAEYPGDRTIGPVPMPVIAWGSPDEDVVNFADLPEWERYSEHRARLHEVSGGHYYLTTELPRIAEVLMQELQRGARAYS